MSKVWGGGGGALFLMGRSWSRHVPVFESPDDLLEEDDSVGNGLVPLHLQQHVMVVLGGRTPEQRPPVNPSEGPVFLLLDSRPGAWLGRPGSQPCSAPWGSLSATGQRGACGCFPELWVGQMEQEEPNLTGWSQRVQWAHTAASSLRPFLPKPCLPRCLCHISL